MYVLRVAVAHFTPRHYFLQEDFLTTFPYAPQFGVQHPSVLDISMALLPPVRANILNFIYFASSSKYNFSPVSRPRLLSNTHLTHQLLTSLFATVFSIPFSLPLSLTILLYHPLDFATSDIFIPAQSLQCSTISLSCINHNPALNSTCVDLFRAVILRLYPNTVHNPSIAVHRPSPQHPLPTTSRSLSFPISDPTLLL